MFLVCFLCTMSVCAQKVTYTGYDVSRLKASHSYYLLNRGTGKFLKKNGSNYTFVSDISSATQFFVEKSGSQCTIRDIEDNYVGCYVNASRFFGISWDYYLNDNSTAWTVSEVDATYKFYNISFFF